LPDPPSASSSLRLFSVPDVMAFAGFVAKRTRRVDFDFSWDEIASIHAAAARGRSVTAHDALCAHAFSALRQLQPGPKPERLVMAVNYRKRVGLPANLLGNVLGTVAVSAGPTDDAASIASNLRSKLQDYAGKHLDYHATLRFVAQYPGRFARMRCMPSMLDPTGGTLIVSSWTRFGLYDLVFGMTAPSRFCSLTDAPLPMLANMFERPAQAGLTLSMHVPVALAKRLDGSTGRALMAQAGSAE
jgi:hypothetical protein